MAVSALAANADRESKGAGGVISYPVAKEAEEFYKGALLMVDSSGYVIVGADTASCYFVGIAVESLSQTLESADGTNSIRVYTKGVFLIGHGTGDAAISSIGTKMTVDNDNSVDDDTATTNSVFCGIIVQWKDADEVWVRIDEYAPVGQ